jgi:rhomboid protease GluP
VKTKRKRLPYLTYLLIAVNLIIFGIEIKLGGSTDLNVLEQLGGLVPERVLAGEWWRVINANFLHYGWLHIGTNMLALYVLGRLIELSKGIVFFLTVYFVSGIGSMTTFVLFAAQTNNLNVLVIGASAAIMGLVGTILAISIQLWLRHRNALTTKNLGQVILIIILQFVFDNLVPQVSFQSHLFGLTIGLALSSFLLFSQKVKIN